MGNDAARFLEEDVAEITHDLKSPLSVIALEVELLNGELGESPQIRKALRRIAQNVAFMDRIVHDLLDMSSLVSERLEIMPEPTSLNHLLAEIIERVVPSRDRPRVQLEIMGAARVLVDVARIERVVANLIANALKYAPGVPVVVRLETSSECARVSIIDSGPGVDDDDVTLLFTKHSRGSNTGKADGSGLGLYVSRKIIEAHGGHLSVHTLAGRGSQFYFDLPLYVG